MLERVVGCELAELICVGVGPVDLEGVPQFRDSEFALRDGPVTC